MDDIEKLECLYLQVPLQEPAQDLEMVSALGGDKEQNSVPGNACPEGLSLKRLLLSITSSMLGAGVLFFHTAIAKGGLLAFGFSVCVSTIGMVAVAECSYRALKAPEMANAQNTPMTYSQLVGATFKKIEIWLKASLIVQAGISILIYQTLIWGWMDSNIELITRSFLQEGGLGVAVVKVILAVPLLAVFLYFSILKEPGDGVTMQIMSISSMGALVLLLVAILCIVHYYMMPVSTQSLTDHIPQLVKGSSPTLIEFLSSVSIIYFGMNSLQNIPIYMSAAKLEKKRNVLWPLLAGIVIVYMVFCCISIEGYFLASAAGFPKKGTDILTLTSKIMQDYSHEYSGYLLVLTEGLVGLFKAATSIVLMNSFMWQCYTYRTLAISLYMSAKYTPDGDERFNLSHLFKRVMPECVSRFCVITLLDLIRKIGNSLPRFIRKTLDIQERATSLLDEEERQKIKVAAYHAKLRWVVGTLIFVLNTVAVILKVDLTMVIQVSGGLIASFLSLLVPAVLLMGHGHIKRSTSKRWFDYVSIFLMIITFFTLSISCILDTVKRFAQPELEAAVNSTASP
ncbi:uncharacterized protein NEMAJ01_1922 [Nematocida major]|uniref:uncharacterized protein n=1 Tax=Nematocida major TaxID=1912982 RepID=UPI002007ADE5|nr:uncharacterized protein NEMAJ01_1922 [Nematocida major]KAH9387026.1 hypothetical protein NEMAJ01_1922 [Nematocida major]